MPRARKTDPATSFEAAASIDENKLTKTQAFILKCLRRPGTDFALAERYANYKTAPLASPSGLRSRRAELVESGIVVDSGLRERLPSGRNAIVWELA